jgi:hypothetical protein
MKKIRVLGVALFALCMFSVIVATASFAGEWLVEGAAIALSLTSETEGLFLIKTYEGPASPNVLVEVLCGGIFDGTVGPGAADLVTELLDLSMNSINLIPLNELALLCSALEDLSLTDCEFTVEGVLVWAVNLPWTSGIELMSAVGETWLDVIAKNAGYYEECKTLIGVVVANECTGGNITLDMSNNPEKMPVSVLVTALVVPVAQRANCTLTGAESSETISFLNETLETRVAEGDLNWLVTSLS